MEQTKPAAQCPSMGNLREWQLLLTNRYGLSAMSLKRIQAFHQDCRKENVIKLEMLHTLIGEIRKKTFHLKTKGQEKQSTKISELENTSIRVQGPQFLPSKRENS